MVLCAKGLAFVHALLIDGYALHGQAKLLDTSALASLELLPRLPLLVVPSCRCHPCGGAPGGLGGGRPQCRPHLDRVGKVQVKIEGAQRLLGSPWCLRVSVSIGNCRNRHELEVRVHHPLALLPHVFRHPSLWGRVDNWGSRYGCHCHQGWGKHPTRRTFTRLNLGLKNVIDEVVLVEILENIPALSEGSRSGGCWSSDYHWSSCCHGGPGCHWGPGGSSCGRSRGPRCPPRCSSWSSGRPLSCSGYLVEGRLEVKGGLGSPLGDAGGLLVVARG